MTYRTAPKRKACIHVWGTEPVLCTKCGKTPSEMEWVLLDHGMLLRSTKTIEHITVAGYPAERVTGARGDLYSDGKLVARDVEIAPYVRMTMTREKLSSFPSLPVRYLSKGESK